MYDPYGESMYDSMYGPADPSLPGSYLPQEELHVHVLGQAGNLFAKLQNQYLAQATPEDLSNLEKLAIAAETELAVTHLLVFNPLFVNRSQNREKPIFASAYFQVSDGDFVERQDFARKIAIPKSLIQYPGFASTMPSMLVSTFRGPSDQLPKPGQVVKSSNPEEDLTIKSNMLDLTILGENLQPLSVHDLVEPIIFQVMEGSVEAGTRCAYLDYYSAWSAAGVREASQEEINAAFPGANEGLWCATNHLSIFAAVQGDEMVMEDLSWVAWALAATAIACAICALAGFVICKAHKRPKAGEMKMADTTGVQHQFKFKVSEMHRANTINTETTEKSDNHESQASGAETPAAKVRVTWDVDVDKVQVSNFDATGKSKKRMSITRLTGFQQSLSKDSKDLEDDDNNPEAAPRIDRLTASGLEPSSDMALDGIMPEDLNAEVAIDMNEKVETKLEAYESGMWLEYYSTTHGTWIQGQVKGKGLFTEDMPSYTVMLKSRFRRQRRDHVEMEQLRRPFKEGDAVSFFSKGSWQDGLVQSHGWTLGYKIQATSEGDDEAELPSIMLSAAEVRPRFPTESEVSVYLGAAKGWVSGKVKTADFTKDETGRVLVDLGEEEVEVTQHQVYLQNGWGQKSSTRAGSRQSLSL